MSLQVALLRQSLTANGTATTRVAYAVGSGPCVVVYPAVIVQVLLSGEFPRASLFGPAGVRLRMDLLVSAVGMSARSLLEHQISTASG